VAGCPAACFALRRGAVHHSRMHGHFGLARRHRVARTVNANPKPRGRRQFVWPVAAIVLGIALDAATNPSKATHITLYAGIAVWCAEMVIVAVLSAHPIGARVGVLVAGLFLPLPFFVTASPLSRCLLICFMGVPLLGATELMLAPPIAGFRAQLAHIWAYFGTRRVTRRARRFDTTALQTLMVATAVLAAAIAAVKAASAFDLGLPVRWLAGGIGILAVAEMATACHNFETAFLGLTVPPLFQSPYRLASVSEFWTKRWNLPASGLLRQYCFALLARRGVALALFTTFALSAVGHALLAKLVLGRWWIAVACGAFFLAQPLVIAAERRLNVRRWRPAAGRAWTLTVLAITSPLVVETILQIVERGWGAPGNVLLPTAAVLGFVTVLSSIVSLASLTSRSGGCGWPLGASASRAP
jgi:Membrane bound O-acyl transferase family